MKSYDPKEPLISIHVPKCAGTSFSNVLKFWFGKGFYQHYHDERQNKPPVKHALYNDSARQEFKHGMCVHGHFNNARGNGVRDYYPETNQFITILRDPFSLHLSDYFYVKRLAQSGDAYRAGEQHDIIEKGWSLADYLREEKESYLCQFLPSDITLDNYKQVLEERFIFVGITENLQESVIALASRLGYPALRVPVSNESKWDEEIPDGALDDFTENNPLEMAIYNYAKNSFSL